MKRISACAFLVLALAPLGRGQSAQATPQIVFPKTDDGIRSTASAPFANFESGPVRPLLLSADGSRLLALNTPDHRLEIWAAPALTLIGSVFTGLEPVSMAFSPTDPNLLFVANLVSDTVAVVDVPSLAVTSIIDVGDEPQDVAVAGGKLFVACARARKLAAVSDPVDATSHWDSNVVQVFDAVPPYALHRNVVVAGHRPRALLVDGPRVHVIPQNSGNKTTVLGERETFHLGITQPLESWTAPDQKVFQLDPPGTVQLNPMFEILVPPGTGRIVLDHERNELIAYLPPEIGDPPRTLPDHDVIAIGVASETVLTPATTGVATTLLALAKNPATGELWVAGTDARNRTRFENNLRGKALDNDVVVVAPGIGGAVLDTVHLRPPLTSRQHAQPAALAFYSGPAGDFAYVAALGSASVVVLDASTRAFVKEIATGEIPSALAVDQAGGILYVFCRGDRKIHRYAIAAGSTGHAEIGKPKSLAYDPEPKIVGIGRTHLYDARKSTDHGNGNLSCASCHVFGHTDAMAWDLGDPTATIGYFFPDLLTPNQNPPESAIAPGQPFVHPIKGPMVTQSLRGLAGGEPFHWRGDRRFFQTFKVGVRGLLGGKGISPRHVQEFASFVDGVAFPPNPFEPDNRVLQPPESIGMQMFGLVHGVPPTPYDEIGSVCIGCHEADFENKTSFLGNSLKVVNDEDEQPQPLSVPTLRGVYEKDFGALTGFGPNHEGSSGDVRHFFDIQTLLDEDAFSLLSAVQRDQMAAFIRSWDTGMAPMVGAQFLLKASTVPQAAAFLNLAEQQAKTLDLDLTYKGRFVLQPGGGAVPVGGFFRLADESLVWAYQTDSGNGWVDRATLLSLAASGTATFWFTCVPPGTGHRLGLDRDEDTLLDGDELALGTDPNDADPDDDGYSDALELQLGGNPNLPNVLLPDFVAPSIAMHAARDVFHESATIRFVTSEPADAEVAIGLAPGSYGLATFKDEDLLVRHDLVLDRLPANAIVFYKITARDKNGNAGVATGWFRTERPHVFVDELLVEEMPLYPPNFGLRAMVRMVDHRREPAAGIPVSVYWWGDTGGVGTQVGETGRDGVVWFFVGPYQPTLPVEAGVTVLMVGSPDSRHPWYVGDAGGTGDWRFFYEQHRNRKNSASIVIR